LVDIQSATAMKSKLNILLVEDSDSDADLLFRFLKKENIEFTSKIVWSRETYTNALKEDFFDVIISDQNLPQFSGMEAFNILKQGCNKIPFILLTGSVSEILLTQFAKEGIDDYILKENLLRLPSAIKHAINKKKIEELNYKLEQAQKDITDSINYAKRIQNAMLPDTAILAENFPESFVFFRPKDTLSGDFYWFKKVDDTFYISAADCTGHGIPGALLSMIGIEKLNNIVHKNIDPSEVLKRLNKRIKLALSESTLYSQSNDGMDISLCSIKTGVNKVPNSKEAVIDINEENNSTDSLHINFSGANRPLMIIRKGEAIITEIKGTKKAIGGLTTGVIRSFENNELAIKKGDTIYISSDGYSDQFGGVQNKKLTTKGFKQLLLGMQAMNMQEQQIYIANFIETWQGKHEQIDDMLVIGIRF